ncbi:MAG: protein kinase [Acidobacteria bacterium]|nr:protein kinase [Acidobacteriota bacterium]MBI3658487.1 protein kinase [Acidobacteriota bacterium]
MTPEQYQQVEQLYQKALERPIGERSAFLEVACAADEALRREVELLLAAYEQAGGFLETPPDDIAAEMLTAEQARSMAGRRLQHYQIHSLLGAGGMGEIYLAQDLTLERPVALKLLPAHFIQDADRMRRFVQEAKAASALSHPNVAHIYEIDEVEGISFIAMEYVEGQTLDARIQGRSLDSVEVVSIGLQVADALEEAHSKGIIHRDIKPANIMITPRGQVKMLDFGLAKMAGPGKEALAGDVSTPAKTQPGVLMGTAEYMSPEQALGHEVDHRTDIFSLGAVMYEMTAGRRPFAGRTTGETLDQIIHAEPEAIVRINPDAAADLTRIIYRCLEKDRERRYRSARELITDLQNLRRELEPGAPAGPIKSWMKRAMAPTARRAVVAGLALLAMAALVYVWRSRGGPGRNQPAIRSLAVLPLKSLSGDANDDYLGLAVADTLIIKLSNLQRLIVRPTSAVRKYNRPEQDSLAAGREQQVDSVLEGSIQRSGERVRVTVRLLRVRDGSPLWAYKYDERQYTDIFAVQDSISERVAEALTVKLTGEERKLLAKHYTENTEAYQLYSKGRYFWNKRTREGFMKALDYFHQAIEKDPNYALAYVGLADSYTMLADYDLLSPKEAAPKAKAAVTKALELDDSLEEAHTSLADIRRFYDWDWAGAEREYRRALELNPHYVTAHQWYAEFLAAMGRHHEARREIRRAEELDPISPVVKSAAGWVLFFARDYEQAIKQCQSAMELDPGYGEVYSQLRRAYEQKGMYREALAADEKLRAFKKKSGLRPAESRDASAIQSAQAYWLMLLQLTKQDLESLENKEAAQIRMAEIFTQLGEKDQAFEWLERVYEEHAFWLPFLKVHPHLDPLRSDPRFQTLLRRVGLSS